MNCQWELKKVLFLKKIRPNDLGFFLPQFDENLSILVTKEAGSYGGQSLILVYEWCQCFEQSQTAATVLN